MVQDQLKKLSYFASLLKPFLSFLFLFSNNLLKLSLSLFSFSSFLSQTNLFKCALCNSTYYYESRLLIYTFLSSSQAASSCSICCFVFLLFNAIESLLWAEELFCEATKSEVLALVLVTDAT